MRSEFFKSQQKNHALQKDGYVVVPFLEQEELETLRSFYMNLHPDMMPQDQIDGIHMTTWCSDLDYKLRVKESISKITKEAVERNFIDYRVLNHVFIVKDKGKKTDFKVHQDWNVVDETQYASVNVWFPLFDVDQKSGALWILKGSHNIDRPIRGSSYLFPDYSPFFDLIEKSATSVPLKAGEAIVFFSNTIHGSPNNLGDRPRIASCFSLIPEKASLHIYFQNGKGNSLEVHEPEDDFMYCYDNLRVDTLNFPPTKTAKHIFDSYINKAVTKKELKPYISKRKFIFF